MSSGPENRFIASLHKKLPLSVHREKMHNPYRGGTFDVWYSGKWDLWIEYKWVDKLPKKKKLVPKLSPLQQDWGRDRYKEGRSVYVIVGCPEGGVLFLTPKEWEEGLVREPMTKPQIIAWITSHATGKKVNAEDPKGIIKRGTKRKQRVQDPGNGVSDIRVTKV